MSYVIHSAKGSTWKKHKYVDKVTTSGGKIRYIYNDNEEADAKEMGYLLHANGESYVVSDQPLEHSWLGSVWKKHRYAERFKRNGKWVYRYNGKVQTQGKNDTKDGERVGEDKVREYYGLTGKKVREVTRTTRNSVDLHENTKFAKDFTQSTNTSSKGDTTVYKTRVRSQGFYDQLTGEKISTFTVNFSAVINRGKKAVRAFIEG